MAIEERSWGLELWNSIQAVEEYTEKEIVQVDTIRNFLLEYAQMSVKFGTKLKALQNKYIPKTKGNVTPINYSTGASFTEIVRIVSEMGDACEVAGTQVKRNVIVQLDKLHKDQLAELKLQAKKKAEIQSVFQRASNTLELSLKKYQTASREMVSANETNTRMQNDRALPIKEQKKAEAIAQAKTADCESAHSEYASKLHSFNEIQKKYYYTELPNWCAVYESMDDLRGKRLREGFLEAEQQHRQACQKLLELSEKWRQTAEQIDPLQNAQTLLKTHRTTHWIPGNREMIDVKNPRASIIHLNEQERLTTKEQINERLLVCRQCLDIREKELLSMQNLAKTFPPDTESYWDCIKETKRHERQINSLNAIIQRVEDEKAKMPSVTRDTRDSNSNTNLTKSSSSNTNFSQRNEQQPADNQDLDSDPDDDDFEDEFIPPSPANPPFPAGGGGGGGGGDRPSLVPNRTYPGFCIVQFEFQPSPEQLSSNPSQLPVMPGEEFYIRDYDDNWTYVVDFRSVRHGFVPTSYIKSTFY